MSPARVIVFIKAPRPGFVKTRLAADIGSESACAAYCELTETVLAKLAPLPHLEMRFTPDNAIDVIRPWLRDNWTAIPQGRGDLGERMNRAFTETGAPAIIVGSDCPELSLEDIKQASGGLCKHDSVIGPAEDGGYWLIGLRFPCPALFTGIKWGTNSVLENTIRLAQANELSMHQLRTLSDVDTIDDWNNFQNKRRSESHPIVGGDA